MNLLFFIFCFLNLYGPLSTNIAFAFNVLLFGYVYARRPHWVIERSFLLISIFLFIIAIIAFITSRDKVADYSSFGIYARLLVNYTMYPSIFAYFYRHHTRFFKILSFTLVLHCTTILMQLAVPQLLDLNSVLFRYERDDLDMGDYSLRMLGLTGGYDQSAFYAVLSCGIALELYFQEKNRMYVLFLFLSFVASLFTSRTGMVASVLVLLVCWFLNWKSLRGGAKLASVALVGVVAIVSVYFILPILLGTIGGSSNPAAADVGLQYSSRTSDYLFDMQLYPLAILNTNELIWGYGCGVNKASSLLFGSDIGYVKQIYQVGIVGVFLIVLFILMMTIRTTKRYRRRKSDYRLKLCVHLIWIMFPLYIIFNYKNHFLYNVCFFDIFLFIYYYSYYRFQSCVSYA